MKRKVEMAGLFVEGIDYDDESIIFYCENVKKGQSIFKLYGKYELTGRVSDIIGSVISEVSQYVFDDFQYIRLVSEVGAISIAGDFVIC